MKKQYLTKNQINKLKQELMSKNKKGSKKGGKWYGGFSLSLENKLLFYEITYDEQTELVTSVKEKEIQINNKKLTFKIY